jgi:hypothetical protein
MSNRTDLHLGIGLDTSEFRKLAKDLRAAKSPLVKVLRENLRAAGEIVAADARIRAEHASRTIPPSIKVRVASTTVAVVAGGEGVPLAGLMELGNAKQRGGDTFRAPNFPPKGSRGQAAFRLHGGHDQPMHPYLGPAGLAHEGEFEKAAVDAVDSVMAVYLTGR